MRVIGYAYEADLHCVECTRQRFGDAAVQIDGRAIDREGNEITAIFPWEEFDNDPYCGDCLERLD